jgi:DNA repair protein RadC
MTTIKQLPPSARPRERLTNLGAASLSDAELLAILIRTGTKSKSALALAQDILVKYGEVDKLTQAHHADLASMHGMGMSKATQVLAAVELGRRILSHPHGPKKHLSSGKAVCEYVQPLLQGLRKELMLALYLNSKNVLLAQETISVGTLDAAHAHPREIFQGAIAMGAKSVIVAHNHPSGDPTPSKEDQVLTRRLRDAGKILHMELLDHIIVGDGTCMSMREEGYWK